MTSAMQTKTVKTSPLYRSAIFKRDAVNEEARTVEISFSSEEPVERWFGLEILDHSPSSIRLGRLADGGALLVDHDPRDHVGVVENVSVDADRKGRAVVRFGEGERASEIFKDVVAGIRTKISVGYVPIRSVLEETNEGGLDVYRVIEWEPYEISVVSIPADTTVGLGRSAEENKTDLIIEFTNKQEGRQMPEVIENTKPAKVEVVAEHERKHGADSERTRAADILAMGDKYSMNELAREHVANNSSVEVMRQAVLEKLDNMRAVEADAPDIGLTDSEAGNFSFVRAIQALANPQNHRMQEAAKFEMEVSAAASEKLKRESRGMTVPVDVLKRDLTVGVAADGGNTVSTDLMTGSFIEMLRNRAFMMQLATVLTDLNGNLAIPRQTGGATAYWVAENGNPTESQQAFDQVPLSPETVGAFTDFSRKLMLQSSLDVEAFVRSDLARTMALEIDRVCIAGSGIGNEPTGILNTTGIGDVPGGANGLAPGWDHVVDLESEVAIDNADMGSLRYLVNAKTRGKLKKTFVDSGSNAERVWDNRAGNTPLNGYEALVTNQVPSDLDKGTSTGVCSALIFGNFADLFIGMWGGLDLTIDPYTNNLSGGIRVVALQDMDVAVRHAQSFAAMQDALTV